METGEDDISQLGILRKWHYKDTTKFFKSPCNVIEGSAGEFWPPNRAKDKITLFSIDLCRLVEKYYQIYRLTLLLFMCCQTIFNERSRFYFYEFKC